MKTFEILQELPKCGTETWGGHAGTMALRLFDVGFLKPSTCEKTWSEKYDEAKHNKTKCVYILLIRFIKFKWIYVYISLNYYPRDKSLKYSVFYHFSIFSIKKK